MGAPTGFVKSWNGMKGYGFINCDGYAGDIMFSRNELPDDARELQGSFLQGRAVTFETQDTAEGKLKASAVHIVPVEGSPLFGAVKSFSDKNGYGFLSSSAIAEDIRFNRTDLPNLMGGGTTLVGQLMLFSVATRPDGKLMAQDLKFQSGKEATKMKGKGKGQAEAIFPGFQAAMAAMLPAGGKGGLMQNMQMSGTSMTGQVKSFSEKNGYGFINVPGQQTDIKFGRGDLNGAESIEAGANVRFQAVASMDGRLQAKQLQVIGGGGGSMKRPAPGAAGGLLVPSGIWGAKAPRLDGGDAGGGATGEYSTGTVKTFNSAKGFGFITSPESEGDLYFMRKDLANPADALGSLQGQAVSYEIAHAPDGKLRATGVSLMT